MKGGPELRLTSALTGGALAGRSTEGGNTKGATHASSPFETLFARMQAEPEAKEMKGGKNRLAPTVQGQVAAAERKAKPGETPEGEADGDGVAADQRVVTTELVNLDHLAPGQSLAHAVAQRIAAAAEGAPVEGVPSEAAPGMRAETRRGTPVAANLALAIAAPRGGGLAGQSVTVAAPGFSVMRRETHFAPVLTETGTSADAGKVAPSANEATGQPGPLALLRGRPEQVMTAARAALGEVRSLRGEAAGASAGTPFVNARGGADGAADETTESMLLQGASAGGAGQPRAAAPAIGSSPTVQPPAPPIVTGAAGPVKVLHIHLQPAELGALEVTMRLTDAGLDVHIEATRHETLTLLRHDREALAQVLRGAGHSADAVTITFADRSAAQGQTAQDGTQSPGARADTQAGAQSGAQSGTPREQGGRPDGGPLRNPGAPGFEKVHDEQDQPVLAARRHGDLYL